MDMRLELVPLPSADVEAVQAELLGRGVEVSGVDDMGGVLFAHFADPDGNSWALQEIPAPMRP